MAGTPAIRSSDFNNTKRSTMKPPTKMRLFIAGIAALTSSITGSLMISAWSPTLQFTAAKLVPAPLHQRLPTIPAKSLPFTFDQVVANLSKTFDLQLVEKRDGKYAAFNLLDTNAGGISRELMRVVVSTKNDRLIVTFSLRETIGMHYLAEFVESPLFTPWESEHLYEVMQRERDTDIPVNLGRFVISIVSSRNAPWQTVEFNFAPVTAA
jgi:hypothetical protein